MRTPEYTGQFKRDYKRETKGQHRAKVEADLHAVLSDFWLINPWSLVTATTPSLATGRITGTATSNLTSF